MAATDKISFHQELKTVLYNNPIEDFLSLGTSTDDVNVNLSEPLTNFDIFEVQFVQNNGIREIRKFQVDKLAPSYYKYNIYFTMSWIITNSSFDGFWVMAANFFISEDFKRIYTNTEQTYQFCINASGDVPGGRGHETRIRIEKVIGIVDKNF